MPFTRLTKKESWLEQPWAFFAMTALTVLMVAIDSTIVAVALPTLVRDLDTTLVLAAWTITAYALAQTVMLPMAGKLAEQFGQMRVFVVCVALFTVGSLLCALAPTIYVLIACRVTQAIGGGGLFPAATGLVAQKFPQTRMRMIGLFASIFPIGGILGPNLGGFVIEHFGWRQTFTINVPLGILVVGLLARQALAAQPSRQSSNRSIDVLGTTLFACSIVAFLVALTMLGQDPTFISSPVFWLLLVGSVVMLGLFVWQETRAPDPILDLSLVVRQPFLVVNIFGVLTGACFMGFFSFIPYFAVVQYGMGPLESGAILTPRSLMMIVVSTATSFLLARLGYRVPMLVGMACVTVALLLLGLGIGGFALGPFQIDPLVPLLCIMALSGLGMGLLIPASNNAGLDLLPRRAAVIAGLRGLFNSTGGVIGTAVIVLWLALSPDKAAGLRTVFSVLGVVMLVTIPLVFLIPDRARERMHADARAESERTAAEVAAARAAVDAASPRPSGPVEAVAQRPAPSAASVDPSGMPSPSAPLPVPHERRGRCAARTSTSSTSSAAPDPRVGRGEPQRN
jgi:EmrB/QacA subfamily drug resistance transporter